MSEPFYQFKIITGFYDSLNATESALDALGRDGWHIVGVTPVRIYLQRLVQCEAVEDESVTAEEVPEEELVDPLCGCGCGESVEIGISAWKLAIDAGKVWYLAGHGSGAARHDGPYAAAPRGARGSA